MPYQKLAGYGCKTTMHVVRLLALQLDRRAIRRISTSAFRHHEALGRRIMLTPRRFSTVLPGSASSILSRRLFFTSRWNCRLQRSQRRAIFT